MLVYQKLNINQNNYSLYVFLVVFLCYLWFLRDVLDTTMIDIYYEDNQLMKYTDLQF